MQKVSSEENAVVLPPFPPISAILSAPPRDWSRLRTRTKPRRFSPEKHRQYPGYKLPLFLPQYTDCKRSQLIFFADRKEISLLTACPPGCADTVMRKSILHCCLVLCKTISLLCSHLAVACSFSTQVSIYFLFSSLFLSPMRSCLHNYLNMCLKILCLSLCFSKSIITPSKTGLVSINVIK